MSEGEEGVITPQQAAVPHFYRAEAVGPPEIILIIASYSSISLLVHDATVTVFKWVVSSLAETVSR